MRPIQEILKRLSDEAVEERGGPGDGIRPFSLRNADVAGEARAAKPEMHILEARFL